jgi:hypothetical protein
MYLHVDSVFGKQFANCTSEAGPFRVIKILELFFETTKLSKYLIKVII